jgi:hypothetical protein
MLAADAAHQQKAALALFYKALICCMCLEAEEQQKASLAPLPSIWCLLAIHGSFHALDG